MPSAIVIEPFDHYCVIIITDSRGMWHDITGRHSDITIVSNQYLLWRRYSRDTPTKFICNIKSSEGEIIDSYPTTVITYSEYQC